jgi:hypothetical protein
MNSLALALTLATLSQTDASLRTLDGQSAKGQLVRLSDSEIALNVAGMEQTFSPSKLDAIGVHEQAASARWKVQVQLVDGSQLNGASYTASGAKAKVALLDGTSHEFPLKSIQSVRLREQTGELARQWTEYLAQAATSDRIIIRRKADPKSGAVESLDVMEGVIKDIGDTLVNFDAGGVVPVKRERVDGVVYFRGREPAPPAASCFVVDIDDSRWSARGLQLTAKSLKFTASGGATIELPLERLRKLDYAAGNRRLLAELPQESLVRETWLSGEQQKSNAFPARVGRTPEGPILLGGEPCPQGLWLPAKSVLIVRVPPGFTQFQAKAGIDDRVASTDGVRLKIEADGKTLLDELIERDVRPRPLKVDLQDARRVRITVDYGGESFLGDQLVLCEAMFVK